MGPSWSPSMSQSDDCSRVVAELCPAIHVRRWKRGATPMIPGELFPATGDIELNVGLPRTELAVANTGDRPIQVGSHYHFAETNPALSSDREAARGKRLDIAAGTAVRFEPDSCCASIAVIARS